MLRPARALALLAMGIAGAGQAAPKADPCSVGTQTFVSPAGEPFHSASPGPAPVAGWFAVADADHDGRLVPAEVEADARRFFATVDTDGSGEIIPDELAAYERGVPAISIYREGPVERRGGRTVRYGAPVGGARYALTNVPNPIAAADLDLDRATTGAELSAAAGRVFAAVARGRAVLSLADLPATPEAALLASCAARRQRGR